MSKLLVFLSHASEDKPRVRRLCMRLKADGFDPWLDEERLLPGMDWDREIKEALRASDAILVCFSQHSIIKEGYIQREYKKAMQYLEEKPENTIYVIPVRLDESEIPYFMQELQYVDFPSGYERLAMALNIRQSQKKGQGTNAVKTPDKTSGTESIAETQPIAQKKPKYKDSGGKMFNIQGGIHAGRDVIQGNQTNYITINNSTTTYASPAELVAVLQQIQAQVSALKSVPELDESDIKTIEAVERKLMDAATEAEKNHPNGERITASLEKARRTMDLLTGSIGSAITLGTTIGSIMLGASKLFGK